MADHIIQGNASPLSTEILANMSHELRGPLTSIKGYAATLLRHEQRLSPEERQAFLQAIHEASDQLVLLLDRFLELSQLEAGTLPLAPAVVGLVSLVREAVQAVQQRIQANHQQDPSGVAERNLFLLHLEHLGGLSPSEEPQIWADRQRVHEVLSHLLENAVLYAPQGSTIDIALHPLPLSRDWRAERSPIHPPLLDIHGSLTLPTERQELPGFEIRISDHGIGIPNEHLEQIFERFYRTDTRLVREANGLGVGLTICKYLVAMHGGHIWVKSQVGQGSTFHVWFPAYGEVDQLSQSAETETLGKGNTQKMGKKKR